MILRRFLVPGSSFLVFLLTPHTSLLTNQAWAASPKVVIDAGHGGTDPGAVSNGLKEALINLDVSERFRDLLKSDTDDTRGGGDWQVTMTRETDVFVSLSSRTDYANSIGADRFLSIHTNSFSDPSANGISTFSYSEGGTGARLRNDVHAEAMKHWPLRDRGNLTANFHVLRETAMPAELHELAFVSNAGDFVYLNDPAKRQEAARAHLHGIQNHYGMADYDPSAVTPPPPDDPPPPPPPSTGTLTGMIYDSSLGTGARIPNADVTLISNVSSQSDLNGVYTFSLSPGDYTVTAVATGYQAGSLSRTVVAGQTTWGSIGLAKIEEPPPPPPPPPPSDTEAPDISIAFPADGATTNQAEITVSGEVTDNLSVTRALVNGVDVTLTEGRKFAASVKLQTGSNKITAEAWDAAGNKGAESVTVTFNPLSGDPGTPPPPPDSPGCTSLPSPSASGLPPGLLAMAFLAARSFLRRRSSSYRG
ncbi:MAG: N-acetylmuramoyl-L-alanine amidase [Nitrospirae bacterium]|nr:N-acetylmuramoyl-L-alanine amidase [Nitrospirota bacterium]